MTDWIVEKHCRLILLLGMGGSGKTFLSIKVAQLIQDQFDFIIWRSLKITNDMRSLNLVISGQEIVDDWVSFFSQSQKTNCSLRELVDYLRCHKCLLILDGLETILKSKNHQGKYEDNYATYRQLLEVLGTTFHQSCAIITSREKPENISFLEKKGKIRSLSLKGEGFYLMNINLKKNNKSKQLTNKMSLFCEYYNNNYAFLNIITEYINSFFEGELEQFIRQETRLVNEIYSLIDEHFERLSPLERIIINEFKYEEKYMNLYLVLKKYKSIYFPELLQGLQSLIARSLIIQKNGYFIVKPIIKEYLKQVENIK